MRLRFGNFFSEEMISQEKFSRYTGHDSPMKIFKIGAITLAIGGGIVVLLLVLQWSGAMTIASSDFFQYVWLVLTWPFSLMTIWLEGHRIYGASVESEKFLLMLGAILNVLWLWGIGGIWGMIFYREKIEDKMGF